MVLPARHTTMGSSSLLYVFPLVIQLKPLKVNYRSWGFRLNPNLYNSGKVCLKSPKHLVWQEERDLESVLISTASSSTVNPGTYSQRDAVLQGTRLCKQEKIKLTMKTSG